MSRSYAHLNIRKVNSSGGTVIDTGFSVKHGIILDLPKILVPHVKFGFSHFLMTFAENEWNEI
jgi:hypothetical protein